MEVTRQVTTKEGKTDRTANVQWNMPTSITEAVERFGKDRMWALLKRDIELDVCAEIGRLMQGGIRGAHALTDEEIERKLRDYIPGTDQAALDRAARALDRANAARIAIGLQPLSGESGAPPAKTARKPRKPREQAVPVSE